MSCDPEGAGRVFVEQSVMQQADSVAIVSGAQIRAARKLLGWSYATLAKKARRRLRLVGRVEEELRDVVPADLVGTYQAVVETLEAAGVEFGESEPSMLPIVDNLHDRNERPSGRKGP